MFWYERFLYWLEDTIGEPWTIILCMIFLPIAMPVLVITLLVHLAFFSRSGNRP